MTQPPAGRPERVRVVLATNRPRGGARTRRELEEQTRVGDVLVRGLVRAQLALALRMALVVTVLLGGLPVLFALAPGLVERRVLGIALPWLLLGVLAYPMLVAVGAAYLRRAERNERDFAELVDRS